MTDRIISTDFIKALDKNGKLHWIIETVLNKENECSFEIRKNRIAIYYKHGKLLEVNEKGQSGNRIYTYAFNYKKYAKRKKEHPTNEKITRVENGELWSSFAAEHQDQLKELNDDTAKEYFKDIKKMMDEWFEENPRKEWNHQHKVSLPYNNDNVLDIEYEIREANTKVDMVMVDETGRIYLVENKYGSKALSSDKKTNKKLDQGLYKHYQDYTNLVENPVYKKCLIDSMRFIIKTKQQLGIMPQKYHISENPEFSFVFLFAELVSKGDSKKRISNICDIMKKEIEKIEKIDKEIYSKYPPYEICVAGDVFRIRLDEKKPFTEAVLDEMINQKDKM
ncbi:hypothetical protein [Butyrivibrio sp. NC2002]|uniref:hypothetical protein n=1 Tax=Butyrivibrio sp. NC2002 TaxID=1410610 RepID=UPI00055C6BE8|nr:hypothetical protein [Butyrivibrio sp. NC2002]